MYIEKNISDAMKAYDKGKKVLVLKTMCDGSISCDKLEDLFPEETHFLVDVPAIENPDFAAAVRGMTQNRTAEPVKEEKEEAEEDTTPPRTKAKIVEKRIVKPKNAVTYDVEELRKYAAQGMTYVEMASIYSVDKSTVYGWCKKEGIKPNKEARKNRTVNNSEETGIGKNMDRHLCKTCMYRHAKGSEKNISCNYICITGQQRGCKPEDCNVYKKGEPRKS